MTLPKNWIELSRKSVRDAVAALPKEIVDAAKRSGNSKINRPKGL